MRNKFPVPFLLLYLFIVLSTIHAQNNKNYLENFPAGSTPQQIGKRVATRFVTTLDKFIAEDQKPHYIHYPITCSWSGALEFAKLTADSSVQTALIRAYSQLETERKSMIPKPDHVDNAVFAIVPFALYRQTKNKTYLEFARDYADKQWGEPFGKHVNASSYYYFKKGLSFETRMWIDDMYMITALQTQAYRTTGNKKYLNRAAREMVYYLDSL